MEFVVLPDHPAASRIRALVPFSAEARVLNHPSGRPWLVGRWSDADLVSAEVGDSRLVLLGAVSASAVELGRRLARVRTVDDLDALTRSLHGAFHLIASIGGVVRAQGSVSSACQVFHGQIDGVTVAADRPQTLGAMSHAGVDEELLSLQLLMPFGPPWPLNTHSVWRGVRALAPGRYLRVEPDGTARSRVYWSPPEPELPLASGVVALREALEGAVAARVGDGTTLSADLSGGKDSTSLCFLAARHAAPLVTLHLRSSDPANEDSHWADRCAARLPDAKHVVLPMSDTPGFFAESALPPRQDLEAPLTLARRPLVEYIARFAASHGATRHLQGIGADELFRPSLMSLHALLRSRPLAALGHVRAMKSMRRWSVGTTVRTLADGGDDYPRWLAGTADRITADRVLGTGIGWEMPPRVPAWTTPEAKDAIRRQLRQAAAAGPEPLSDLPVHHEMLRVMQVNGTIVRSSSRIVSEFGVSFQAPFLDDRVIAAVMSIRLADRHQADQVKPVLVAALRGIAPDDLLDRRTKGDMSPELYHGLRQHRQDLTELFADSRLARLGLIDATGPRDVLRGLHSDAGAIMPLDATLANELWLRSIPADAA